MNLLPLRGTEVIIRKTLKKLDDSWIFKRSYRLEGINHCATFGTSRLYASVTLEYEDLY
jgi:hypothetical protein